MAVSGASVLRSTVGRTVLRRAATQNRTQAWRQIGRRHYASGHTQAKSSELPWIIGSAGLTVPAAVWLYGQGPKKGVHHPEAAHKERDEKAKDKEEPAEEASEAKPGEAAPSISSAQAPSDEKQSTKERQEKQDEEGKSDSDQSKEEGEGTEEGGPESKNANGATERKHSDDGYEPAGPNAPGQINYKPGSGKGPGEGQKGSRDPPELKGEKDSRKDDSEAANPYLGDATSLEKGEGVKESSKIHGTVDSRGPARAEKGKSN